MRIYYILDSAPYPRPCGRQVLGDSICKYPSGFEQNIVAQSLNPCCISTNLFVYRGRHFDEILNAIADDLIPDEHIEALGSELGILRADIDRCIETNRSGPQCDE